MPLYDLRHEMGIDDVDQHKWLNRRRSAQKVSPECGRRYLQFALRMIGQCIHRQCHDLFCTDGGELGIVFQESALHRESVWKMKILVQVNVLMSDGDDLKVPEITQGIQCNQWFIQIDQDVWLMAFNEAAHFPEAVQVSACAAKIVQDGCRHMDGTAFLVHRKMRALHLQQWRGDGLKEKIR